jgi:hypothetical protein
MNLQLIFAVSLVVTFLAWYICGVIPGRMPRGVLRATLIALLCSPGLLVGHGLAVVPSLFALSVQLSVFTLGPMLLVWIIALGVIFGVDMIDIANGCAKRTYTSDLWRNRCVNHHYLLICTQGKS